MARTPPAFWSAVLSRLPGPARRWADSPAGRRMIRFGPAADRRISLAALYARWRRLLAEAARFGLVGLAGLAVTDGGTDVLQYRAGLDEFSSVAVASVAATAVTFAGSRYWTFRHRERSGMGRETVVFFVLNGIGIGIYEGCVGLADLAGQRSGLAYTIALNTGIALGTVFRYWAYKKWVWPAAATGTAARVPRPGRAAGMARAARDVLPELGRFSVVAVVATALADIVTGLLHGPGRVGPASSALTAAALAVLVSYAGNRYWTFRHRQRGTVPREGARYLLLSAVTLAIQAGCLRVSTGLLGQHGRLPVTCAAVAGVVLVLLLRYWSCRAWVWRWSQPARPAGA